jgi:hypothetical protein
MLHVVLFKLNPEKLASIYPGNALQDDVNTLRHGAVPGLLEIHLRPVDKSPWEGYVDASHGYTHALVSRHESVEALQLYTHHHVHKALQARMAPCVEGPPLRVELHIGG